MFINSLLRRSMGIYPFIKGRHRIMTLLEKLAFPCKEEITDLHRKFHFRLDLTKKGLQRSFFYFIPEYYEPGTQRYLKQFVKPGMVVIDIGAHIGFFTLLLAGLVGEKGKVYSFEPEEKNFYSLKENISINNIFCVKLFQIALSDREGMACLYIDVKDDGHHSLKPKLENVYIDRKQIVKLTRDVKTATLDNIIRQEGIDSIDLIKIDAEKAEPLILKGCKEILSRKDAPHIICETHTTRNEICNAENYDVRNILYSYGYKSYLLEDKYLIELGGSEPLMGLQNLLYLKE